MSGETKFWAWKCEACGKEFVIALANKMHGPCHTYGCGGTHFLKVGQGETKEEARRDAERNRR